MKWTLVYVMMSTAPVPTGLVFGSLQECLDAEIQARSAMIDAFNEWFSWAQENPHEANYPESKDFMEHRFGLKNIGSCIPAAND